MCIGHGRLEGMQPKPAGFAAQMKQPATTKHFFFFFPFCSVNQQGIGLSWCCGVPGTTLIYFLPHPNCFLCIPSPAFFYLSFLHIPISFQGPALLAQPRGLEGSSTGLRAASGCVPPSSPAVTTWDPSSPFSRS